MTKVKICGITNLDEVTYINEFIPDYAGFVMFFPKSKRSISPDTAKTLLKKLDRRITSVAVTVAPTMEQIKQACECGFDLIQIHGTVADEILSNPYLKVLKAFNVSDVDNFQKYSSNKNITGYVFDSAAPGSGKTFDWNILKKIPRDGKTLILAGGLNPDNVVSAINSVCPDGVDVSSGVENENGQGKSRKKISEFIANVRHPGKGEEK